MQLFRTSTCSSYKLVGTSYSPLEDKYIIVVQAWSSFSETFDMALKSKYFFQLCPEILETSFFLDHGGIWIEG